MKRTLASEEPELFAVHGILVAEHSEAAGEHVAGLLRQMRDIIDDGVATGTSP